MIYGECRCGVGEKLGWPNLAAASTGVVVLVEWNWQAATRSLVESTEPTQLPAPSEQVRRAIAALLGSQRVGDGVGDDALTDQMIIVADHFRVPEAYFTDPTVGERIAARRRAEIAARRDLAASEEELRDAMRRAGVTAMTRGCRGGIDRLPPRDQAAANRALAHLLLDLDNAEADDEALTTPS